MNYRMDKIAVIQIDSELGNTPATLAKIDARISEIQDPSVRMAVFCEYGTVDIARPV